MLSRQTGGEIKETDFIPRVASTPVFLYALYMLNARGEMKPLTSRQERTSNNARLNASARSTRGNGRPILHAL
jgi:hypothetical protein